ncbi:MAG: YraN family protein [Phycisphaerales bacterium]|nr:YraN family protein [Phycisphaerales bacterium]
MADTSAARRQELGRLGESAAADHLQALGFELLGRNVRVGRHEADLVMRDPDGLTVVVVEVKTRSSGAAWPEERIDKSKRRSLSVIALTLEQRSRSPVRIDAASVTIEDGCSPRVRHFRDAVQG